MSQDNGGLLEAKGSAELPNQIATYPNPNLLLLLIC